jgi:hypothetical protein
MGGGEMNADTLATIGFNSLPYGIREVGIGVYEVFNRDYQALGKPFKANITRSIAESLSYEPLNSPNACWINQPPSKQRAIWLYKVSPKTDKSALSNYLQRLTILADIETTHD